MIIEVELTKEQFKELRSEMGIKSFLVKGGMMDSDIRDEVCMRVLRGCRKDMVLEEIAGKVVDG